MGVTASFLLCCILLVAGLLSAEPQQPQSPLITISNGAETQQLDLIYELHKAEIIPTVLDEFIPQYTVHATWSSPDDDKKNITAAYGNTLPVSSTQEAPKINLIRNKKSHSSSATLKPHPQLTLVITDPDAPSRDNPEWSEVCHWVVTFPTTSKEEVDVVATGEDVMPYKPPGPPPKTGKHRYVLVALAPLNETTETLLLTPPEERRRWGYEKERTGLRKWMGEMGLGVVGANFIYEQNEEQ